MIQLDGRAGSPPAAGTLLLRHAEAGGLEQLDLLLRDWEVWASELLESHLSYPMLAYYRSQHDNESWLAAIGCIMDTCALVLVGVGDVRPLQARMTFTMTRQVLVEMARSFRVKPSRFTGATGWRRVLMRSWSGCWWRREWTGSRGSMGGRRWRRCGRRMSRCWMGWRVTFCCNYRGGCRRMGGGDNWQQGPRGLIAGRLIGELARSWSEGPEAGWRLLSRRGGAAGVAGVAAAVRAAGGGLATTLDCACDGWSDRFLARSFGGIVLAWVSTVCDVSGRDGRYGSVCCWEWCFGSGHPHPTLSRQRDCCETGSGSDSLTLSRHGAG